MRLSPDKFLSEVVMKSKFFFIGRILELLEVRHPASPLPENLLLSFLRQTCFLLLLQLGVQTEGIKELLMNTDFDLEAISNKVSIHGNWKR